MSLLSHSRSLLVMWFVICMLMSSLDIVVCLCDEFFYLLTTSIIATLNAELVCCLRIILPSITAVARCNILHCTIPLLFSNLALF